MYYVLYSYNKAQENVKIIYIEKNRHIIVPTQFKPMLFRDQL